MNTRTEPVPRCYLCGSKGVDLYSDLPDTLFGSTGRWNLKECPEPSCGLIWLAPRPIEEDIGTAYQTYFTHGSEEQGTPAKVRLREALYTGYRSLVGLVDRWTGLAVEKHQLARMYLDDLPPGRLFDVGCGDGTYLNRMKQAGWQVDGCDFDRKAISYAKNAYGLDLRLGTLESQRLDGDHFDAVTLSHVIEHVYDPIALMREVRRILKPGGRTVVVTPNTASRGRQLFGETWVGLDPPRHIHIFNLDTLEQVVEKAELEVRRRVSTAASADILLGCSASIRIARANGTTTTPSSINPRRALWAMLAQQREFHANKANLECGEESVVVACK